MKIAQRIAFFPMSFYSVVMGLLGLVIATQKSTEIFHLNNIYSIVLLIFVSVIFCVISIVLLNKIFLYTKEIVKDFLHPVKISFFPTFSVSLLLFAIALLSIHPLLSNVFWLIGTITHLLFTFVVISQWLTKSHYKIEHLSPAWFIPVVGNLLVPVAGVIFAHEELLWFFFSIGIVFWLILMTIVVYRIFFHEPLSQKMTPTLFILIAPPSIGFISYFKLTHQIDNFSRIMYYFSLFMALLLIANIRMFFSKKFYLSQWAFTFPLAAISIASALMFHQTKISIYMYVHLMFLVFEALIISVLLYKTGKAIYFHEICHEE